MYIRISSLALILAASGLCHPVVEPLSTSSSFAYTRDVNVAYDVQGSGSIPVVLIHGLAASKEAWNLLTPGLLEVCGCRIYRLDLRGHGDTSAPNDYAYSVGENARIVRAFLAQQKLRDVVLVGHSYGGAVALKVALDAKTEDPGLLRSLVLMSTPAVEQRFPFLLSHQKSERYGAFVDRVTPARFRALVVVHGANPRITEGSRARLALYSRLWKDHDRSRAARRTARQFLDGGDLRELAARNHDTGVPTLIIAGTRDHIVRLKRSRELAATMPNAKLEVIPKTGHAMQEDAPDRVVPVLAPFVKNPGTRPAVARKSVTE